MILTFPVLNWVRLRRESQNGLDLQQEHLFSFAVFLLVFLYITKNNCVKGNAKNIGYNHKEVISRIRFDKLNKKTKSIIFINVNFPLFASNGFPFMYL